MRGIEQAEWSDLPEFRVGSVEDERGMTGVTAIVAPEGACASVSVRGGGPATRETDLLDPERTVQEIHAVVLSGGSTFGLAAADGAARELERRGIGLAFAGSTIPLVCGASLFDLLVGDPAARPDAQMGADAVACALAGGPVRTGNVGAGMGATVGKFLGLDRMMKSGLGCSLLRSGELVVGAVVAVNAIGCVLAEDGEVLAGVLGPSGDPLPRRELPARFLESLEPGASAGAPEAGAGSAAGEGASGGVVANTTIGCILTNARLDKGQARKVADLAHDSYARRIYPVHTMNDGDSIFCLASGRVDAGPAAVDACGILAQEAMALAIADAALSARTAGGVVGLAG